MPNIQNLKPNRKGEPRDPICSRKGRPNRKTTLDKYSDVEIDQLNPIKKIDERLTVDEHIALILLAKCLSGDLAAIKEYYDRVEGKPNQSITGKNGESLFKEIAHSIHPFDPPPPDGSL